MPKILITGNGFDLNLNLPTSYNDFIKILNNIEQIEDYTFHNIYSPSNSFTKIKENFTNYKFFDIEQINCLKKLLNENLWYNFFKSEFNIETWIDFEVKIEYVLKNIFKSLNILEETVFNQGSLLPNMTRCNSTHFKNNIEIIEILKSFKLMKVDRTDFILNKILFTEKYNYNISFNYKAISDFLYFELLKFKKIFNLYFEIVVIPLYNHRQTIIKKDYFEKINYHFTFNYTPSFEKIYGKNIKTNYLHGKINSEENNIVLGIDNIPIKEKNENTKYYIPFTKYYQKLNNDTDYYFLNEISDKRKVENYIFYFIGHSLDKSDNDYINEIFDFVLELKSKIKKIIIAYHSEESKSSILVNLIEIRGKNDIVLMMREKWLVFLKLNSQEFENEINKNITIKRQSLI